ncbi:hypothetical protein BJ944DRAFT_289889 [Cunninghamella echinulata]|nr:hypothetical protein BJ944DRAFT_289889 [Cunninghamella echinulata]
MELDEALMEQLLAKLNWKSGIRPLGDIATESCFVQKQMPFIKQQLVETQSSSILVTQSSWTNQLIHSGVISDINDHTTMHSLSELHLLFHTRQQQPAHRTFHRLQYDAHAYFLVNQILRPTIKFQRVLESALNHLPNDPDRAWQELCKVWHDFGFLWPQKIILGCKHHIKHVYQVQNDKERLPQLQSANEITSNAMNIKLQKYGRSKGLSSFTNQHNSTSIMNEDHQKLRQSVLSWEIIKRTDVRPIYEFLPTDMRNVIYQLIKQFVHRIPFNTPFLLRNISTGGYLCWRRNIRQQVQQVQQLQQQQQQVHEHTTSKQENHQHKPYLFATLPIADVNIQSFTWKFTNTIPNNASHLHQKNPKQIEKYVRCGSQLYLSSFDTQQNKSHQPILPSSPPSSLSHQILTSNLSDGIKSLHWNPILEKTTRVRSLEFTNLSTPTDVPLQQQQQHCWTIESPDLGLDHDDDISTDGHLNVDIVIGRLKPILHKEIISLRQILYLCSVNNQVSRSSSLTQGIHQSNTPAHPNHRHRHRHKNMDECESPPFLGIPSPVPPAAAAVMAMVQHDLFEESSPDSYLNNNNDSITNNFNMSMNQQQRFDESNIISSNSTLPLTSTTANTSQTSLPFYNLQTYTVLSNPSKVFSPMISPSHSTSPLLPTQQKQKQQHQHSLNPVLAKERALISELEESYWMIELYSQFEKDQHEQLQQQQHLHHHHNSILPKQQQQQNKGKQRLQLNDHREPNTKQPQLKMVMSLDTLREDAQNNKQMDNTFNNGDDNGSLRRVQSFSSVYDQQFNQKQQEEQQNNNSSTFQRFAGMLIEKNETKKHNYNHSHHNNNNNSNNNNDNRIQPQQQDLNTSTSTNTYIYKDQFMLTGGIAQERAHHKVQPYLRLYAAKQNNKTWSHFFKQSSLTNVKRWLKSE